jgi:general secretion pathway protein D
MNNKKAVIQIGQTIPVPEVSRGISGDLILYKEKDVSMRLEVIPHIGSSNDITLDLHPILEEIIGYTGPAEAQQPITSKREVKTTVLIKDGETVVIGGLIKETETENIKKVWLLGDIPLLGYLFKHSVTVKQRSDLLIFITTKIFEPGVHHSNK